jgi:DnaA family protein
MLKQALLDLFKQECEFDNFIQFNNQLAFTSLSTLTNQFTHLFGEHNVGKTHLLKAWVNLANRKYNSAIYLMADELTSFSIYDIDLDTYKFIAIDDIDNIDNDIQDALFKLFNRIKLTNGDTHLLTSSSSNLNQVSIRDDLKTRIHSGVVFQIRPLSDDMLMNALISYTNKIGLVINVSELGYLINHTNRNLGEIIDLLNKISHYAVTHKKNISIHTIKQAIFIND